MRYVLDTTDEKVENMRFTCILQALRMIDEEGVGSTKLGYVIEVLEVLVENGWDVNEGAENGYVLSTCAQSSTQMKKRGY